jgi:hypothetical protein
METLPTKLDYRILESMEQRGGGFASALAKAAYRADDVNFAKLKGAFPELWEHHAMHVEHCSKRAARVLSCDS